MAQFELEPKQYQKQALQALTEFLQAVRASTAERGVMDEAALSTAFADTVAAFDPAIKSGAMRPKKYQNTYQQVPNVCLRIPTGGGKTLLGAHAIETEQFSGGNRSAIGRDSIHASTSFVSHPTRRPDNWRGLGNPCSRTSF